MNSMKSVFRTGPAMFKNAYGFFKKGISTGYNFLDGISSTIHSGAHWVDRALKQASAYPFIGEFAHLIREDPLYDELIGGIDTIDASFDELRDAGNLLDRTISGGINRAQRFVNDRDAANRQPVRQLSERSRRRAPVS